MLHIGIDADGTLASIQGHVTEETCAKLTEKGAKLWLVSKRDTHEESIALCKKYYLEQCPMLQGNDYVQIKINSLTGLILHHKIERLVYVGDRVDDITVAWGVGAIYCHPKALDLNIFAVAESRHVRAIF